MTSIEQFLKQNESKELLRFSTAGSIDDGKSTLIGRLLHDSKVLYEDHIAAIRKSSRSEDAEELDYALFTDGLKAEREQGITIDVAYRYFSTQKRKFIIADTPGHEQYTRNMATGASTADLAIVLIDARNGVLPQTKRHAFISALLGVPHMVVAVNKMDLVEYDQAVYEDITTNFKEFAQKLEINDLRFLPISALRGDNVVEHSGNMDWYRGESLMEILENVYIASDRNFVDLRFPVQYVLRPHQNFRGYCGQVMSGVIKPGDEVITLPSMKMSRVRSIETYEGLIERAYPPMSITVTLESEIDISRGDMIVHRHNHPRVERHFESMLVWMGDEPMNRSDHYYMKVGTQVERVRIDEVRYEVDVETLSRNTADRLSLNQIGRVIFTSTKPLFFDAYGKNRATGNFILIDPLGNNTVAAGMMLDREPASKLPASVDVPRSGHGFVERTSRITSVEREKKLGHEACTVWLTGLVASGKTEIAYVLERRLFDAGCTCVVLDGENIRLGLCKDLNFSSTDRAEHLRRVAETAKIMNDAGLIVICAFTSPVASERAEVMSIIGEHRFVEVHVDASLEWCESQDKTGLYTCARQGKIDNVAGINMPYEVPTNCNVTINAMDVDNEEAVEILLKVICKEYFTKYPCKAE